MASVVTKATTGLTGLRVVQSPAKHLRIIYARTLKALDKMPKTACYRQSTEAALLSRLDIIDAESDPTKLEQKLAMGQLEEVILQAEMELNLARTMIKYEPWKSLSEKPDDNQWKWPIS